VGTSAKALATALKGEFATQISAIESSLSAIGKSLGDATGSLSAAKQAIVSIPGEVNTLKRAAAEIQQVTKSKCE
jgi:phage-related tail protein